MYYPNFFNKISFSQEKEKKQLVPCQSSAV